MACGGGTTERIRQVLIPIRGEGTCPARRNADRYEIEECNTHECVGDEVCIANQDLVLTVDGSGSLRESGFEIVRDFAANVTTRYQSKYFGNGELTAQPDGTTTIAEALYIQGLTSDLALI